MYHPPDYIDNTSDDHTLMNVLHRLLVEWEEKELDIASGFFEPNVWQMLSEALGRVESFRLLLGRAPELEAMGGDNAVDLQRFYRDRLRQDLERLPFNRDYALMIDELTQFLAQEHIKVNYYNGQFLHAKAYLMPHAAIVGSSNFTPAGMTRRAELNLLQQNQAVIKDLRENWFESMWAESTDHKGDLIDALDESKFGGTPWTPHQVFIKVLYEYFRDRLLPDAGLEPHLGVELASFQQEGLREAIRLIDRHGGVIVSDAVGLGKTYIGMSLLEHYVLGKRRKGFIPRGLVICPAQLRDLVWVPKLDEYGIKAEVISQESVSRGDFDWKKYNQFDVILVDESHNFRNPGTNRSQNLLKLLATGNPNSVVILMTATPVNNSVWDLYHQISFITRGQDAFYREYGIRNLKSFFHEVQDGGADIFALLEQTMVRRSRQDIKQRQEAGEEIRLPGKGVIRFPDRRLHVVEYDLAGTYDGFYEKIVAKIESLALIAYNIEQYRLEVDQEVERIRQYSDALIGILKTLYLKRLESSLTAFEVSIRRQQVFQDRFYDLLVNHEKLLDSATNRRLLALEATEDDTAGDDIEAIIAALPEADIRDYDLKALRRELERDSKALQSILDMVEIAQRREDDTRRDAKLAEVKAYLSSELPGHKVLIFTYYRDTAQYVFDHLRNDPTWQETWGRPPVIEVIHGETDGLRREKLVKRFAPVANTIPGEDSSITEHEPEIDILISTDVLSEGQNLQDAGVMINYDLHWTPIRMIQRAGRIDRLGTAFEELHIYNCFPQHGLEALLGLVQRLQDRIRQIDSTVGLDASILGETVSTRSLEQLRRLRGGDESIIDELERELEMVSTDEMKLPLMLYLQQMGMEAIRNIPLGIGSGIARSRRPSGVFFAFQAGDRHFWRLYTADGEVIGDKRRLFNYLQVPPDEPRVMPTGFDIFDTLDNACNDVLGEINSVITTGRVRPKLGKLNIELSAALQQASMLSTDALSIDDLIAPTELREKVQRVLQTVPLEAFRKDKKIKAIRAAYQSSQNQRVLAESLDEFFVENELYRDVPTPKVALEQIKAEELKLIAYEVFGS